MKILFFALAANVAVASACAAMARASGHKARAVDATLLTKADRESADVVVTHVEAESIVRAAYDDLERLFVVNSFDPVDFIPERMKELETSAAAPRDSEGQRLDGPTVEQFVQAGCPPGNYPPAGYASRSTEEEIAAAIAAHAAKGSPGSNETGGDTKVTAAELREALTAKGIVFKANASKTELQALLAQAS